MGTYVTSLRIPAEVRDQYEQLAEATGRTRGYLMAEALATYVRRQLWQVHKIQRSLEHAQTGLIVPTEEMDALFDRLTTSEALERAQRDTDA